MIRSHWKGFISFGLVSIPINIIPVVNNQADISFHLLDKKNNARIRYERVNSVTGKKVASKDIIKGYEVDKETLIPMPPEVLKKIAADNEHVFGIENFIAAAEFDPIYVNRSYLVSPGKKGEKGCALLYKALQDTDTMGVGKIVISTKDYLAVLRPYRDDVLLIHLLNYEHEINQLKDLDFPKLQAVGKNKITPQELTAAKQLIHSMSTKWRAAAYVDEYQIALQKWVAKSFKHAKYITAMPSRRESENKVIDLVAILKKSLQQKSSGKPHSAGKKTSAPKTKKVSHR